MQQQQHTKIDICKVDYNDILSSLIKYDHIQIVTISHVKQKLDDFIQLPSFSSRNLIEIFDFLNGIHDKRLLTDTQLINHKVYFIFSIILKNLLNKWYTTNSFTQFESSYLFPCLIELFCKMNYYSIDLIEPLKKWLNDIVKHGQHLKDITSMAHLSKLVELHIQNEQIMNAIVNCLCSDHYLNMFQRTDKIEKFLLLKCPRYFQNYQGLQKKEMAEKLLNVLLKPTAQLLIRYPKSMEKPVAELLNLLNYSFQLCSVATIFDDDLVLPLVDALMSILDENSSIVKYYTDLLRTLINKNETILKYIQQRLKGLIQDSSVNFLSDSRTTFEREIDQENDVKVHMKSTVNSEEIVDDRQVSNPFFSSIYASNEHQNKEEMTLIWCDENIDVHGDAKKIIELLQQVNDYVLICSNIDTCLEYINRIQTEKAFVILSSEAANEMIDKIHNLKQVSSIYIFCMNDARYEYSVEKYYKINGIYIEYEPLLKAIEKNISYLLKQSQAKSLFDQYERSMRSLNSESQVFVEFRTFKYVLLKTDCDKEQAKKEMIAACRNYYKGNVTELTNIQQFEQTYDSNNAIQWYTKSTFVFRLVNQALRTEDYEGLLTLRFYITDLYENIRLKYEDLKQQQQRQGLSTIVTYRGIRCAPHEVYTLKYNIGKTIAINGFLSTSRSKFIAEIFSGKGTPELGFETVMLEIHVDTTKPTIPLADIAEYSIFPEEEEVLFGFGATFIINSVTYDTLDDVWWVKLSAVSEDVLTDNIQTLLKSFKDTEMNLLFGVLLIKMGLYRQCRKHLESLFDLYGNQHEHVVRIEELMGWSYEGEKKYDQAIPHYENAFNLSASSNRWEDASRITNSIATCYYMKNDKVIARQYTTKAYEILKNRANLPDNHCRFGIIMTYFGEIEDDNSLALDYHEKALGIFQNASTMCECQHHDDRIAKVYEIIGARFRNERNYAQAIVYFQKCEKLRSKYITLREERMAYVCTLIMLGACYTEIEDEVTAQMYHLKFLRSMDNDLMELIYGNDLDAKEGVLTIQATENISESRLIYEVKLLKSLETTQPMNHEQIIERYLNIGEIYTKTKDHKWAHQHYDKAYDICQTKISSKHALAQCLFDIGQRSAVDDDVEYAFKFMDKSLETRLLILKSDDVNIGFSHYMMSLLYDYLKQYDMGIEHCEKAIKIFEKYLSDEENDQFDMKYHYAICYNFGASLYQKKQELVKSIEYLIMAVNHIERFISKMPDSYCLLAKCYRMMANIYYQLLDKEASLTYSKKYLETMEKHLEVKNALLLPHDHTSEVSETLHHLAIIYRMKMDYDQSIFYYEKFVKSPSADPHKILLSYASMGECYMNQSCYAKAIENYEKAATNFECQLPNHFDLYAECVGNMTVCYLKMGKSHVDYANECILKVINMYEHDDNENKTGFTYCFLLYGLILMVKGQYVTSIKILNQTLALAIENKPILTQVQRSLSVCFYEITDYQNALIYAKLSIENYRGLCPELNNEDSADIYKILASCFFRLNNLNDALSYTLKYQKIIEKLSAILTVRKAIAHSMLASIYSKQHRYKKANSYCKTALDICEQLIKNKDEISDIGLVFENIGELSIDQNHLEKAKMYYEEALKFYKLELIDDHPKCQHLQSIINKIPEIELENQEKMRTGYQSTLTNSLPLEIDKLTDDVVNKFTTLYRTVFPFH